MTPKFLSTDYKGKGKGEGKGKSKGKNTLVWEKMHLRADCCIHAFTCIHVYNNMYWVNKNSLSIEFGLSKL